MRDQIEIRGRTVSTEEVAEALRRHLIDVGDAMLEKNFIDSGTNEIVASLFFIEGEDAAEMTAMIREWADKKGMNKRRLS